ncbi:MAG: ABC transporter ATP-binding protein [Acidobacteria bacterium]|nr:ABC transporter ATP-binding protein [Acidobacteriota bacterium]
MTGSPASSPASSHAVVCRGLQKRYGKVVAVDGLDLDVRTGECFGLLGPNGAGKTTTIEILEGLLKPDAGEVEILGLRWGVDDQALRQRLGIQLQDTHFSDKLTVEEVVRLFRSFYRRGPSVDDVLAMVELESKRGSWVSKLSGGQKQRLAVACALVNEPDLLFLDEPTTGLDPQSRRQLWSLLGEFRRRGGTIVLTTHYMDEAETLCDRVGIVDQGRLIALGTPRELIATLGAEHVIEFELEDGALLADATLQLLPGVRDVRRLGGSTSLRVRELHTSVPALLAELERERRTLSRFATHHASLEDVFVAHTGRHLRDE